MGSLCPNLHMPAAWRQSAACITAQQCSRSGARHCRRGLQQSQRAWRSDACAERAALCSAQRHSWTPPVGLGKRTRFALLCSHATGPVVQRAES